MAEQGLHPQSLAAVACRHNTSFRRAAPFAVPMLLVLDDRRAAHYVCALAHARSAPVTDASPLAETAEHSEKRSAVRSARAGDCYAVRSSGGIK